MAFYIIFWKTESFTKFKLYTFIHFFSNKIDLNLSLLLTLIRLSLILALTVTGLETTIEWLSMISVCKTSVFILLFNGKLLLFLMNHVCIRIY